jgi:hypothetical protein
LKLLAVIGGSGVLVSGLYAGGAIGAGQVYDLPLATVKSELVAMPLSSDLLNLSAASTVDVETQDGSVRWEIMRGDQEVATFVAHLRPARSGKTRVTVDYIAASDPKLQDRLSSTAFLRNFAQSTFEEQVDARLEGRPYDQAAAMRAFAEHTRNHPEDVREMGMAVGGMFAEVNKQAGRTRGEVRTVHADRSMAAATRPSTTLNSGY